ncbi:MULTISPECIES: hypothetical protein [Novosphingobium]|uniref:hypothetical protein n=1 Tax=Novosphingobium TaxID=165696 RepID=UPI0022F27F38|nr:hypothetical protein [Novosphingobium resinovorum]
MDMNTLNRSRAQQVARVVEIRAIESGTVDADAVPAALLRDAVREAGLFQRSVLGHLDHKEWRDRVRADGQRLMDLLAEIGFRPSERAARKSA